MANKWQITIDVDEEDVALLVKALRWQQRSWGQPDDRFDDLKDQIELSWIEREVELIPPPSEHSTHVPVYRGGCSEEIVANGYVVAP